MFYAFLTKVAAKPLVVVRRINSWNRIERLMFVSGVSGDDREDSNDGIIPVIVASSQHLLNSVTLQSSKRPFLFRVFSIADHDHGLGGARKARDGSLVGSRLHPHQRVLHANTASIQTRVSEDDSVQSDPVESEQCLRNAFAVLSYPSYGFSVAGNWVQPIDHQDE
ncbi:hypothetical protein SODALDRAFT_374618 [Sodiomyces alkalinus F11]|uniref:Uncharacterized protein n=1 Tax=Sodiomyces alkalinus (strain CBS 110278 / VKM F-3762 / F11) TaxID=1314773 RepID=A0A3N2Q6L9_SODAK|nr:hypothetical protein SODALDRAFT_374618 [Sodiomyces alkalinus F11]ROT42265.1 hypothetical protein SODALDRAFT_374618 [Sodiomyces alkalinus F11]